MKNIAIRDRIRELINSLAEGSQKQFALLLDIEDPSIVGQWLNKDKMPGGGHLKNLQEKIKEKKGIVVNLNWLLNGIGEKYLKDKDALIVKEETPFYGKRSKIQVEIIKLLDRVLDFNEPDSIKAVKAVLDALDPDADRLLAAYERLKKEEEGTKKDSKYKEG